MDASSVVGPVSFGGAFLFFQNVGSSTDSDSSSPL